MAHLTYEMKANALIKLLVDPEVPPQAGSNTIVGDYIEFMVKSSNHPDITPDAYRQKLIDVLGTAEGIAEGVKVASFGDEFFDVTLTGAARAEFQRIGDIDAARRAALAEANIPSFADRQDAAKAKVAEIREFMYPPTYDAGEFKGLFKEPLTAGLCPEERELEKTALKEKLGNILGTQEGIDIREEPRSTAAAVLTGKAAEAAHGIYAAAGVPRPRDPVTYPHPTTRPPVGNGQGGGMGR